MRTFKVYGHDNECEKNEPGALCYYSDVEPILNSLQQLKAEIRSLYSRAKSIPIASRAAQFSVVLNKLRELSAV